MQRVLAPHDIFVQETGTEDVIRAVESLKGIRTKLLALGDSIQAQPRADKRIRRELALLYRDIDNLKIIVGGCPAMSAEELETEEKLRRELRRRR